MKFTQVQLVPNALVMSTTQGTITTPGTASASESNVWRFVTISASAIVRAAVTFKCSKRVSPTFTIYSATSGASGSVDINSAANSSGIATYANTVGAWAECGPTVTANSNIIYGYEWVADARI